MHKFLNSKKLISILLSLIMSFSLVACGGDDAPFATKNGEILEFSDTENLRDGYYLKKNSGIINPLLTKGVQTIGAEPVVMYSNFDNLIPTYNAGDELIFKSKENFPADEGVKFTKLKDIGYTVGTNFITQLDEKGDEIDSKIFFGSQTNPYSPIADYLEAAMGSNYRNYQLLEVNGQEFKPNLLSRAGFLQGLSKDALYQFKYYKGTIYKSVEVKADSHVMEAKREINGPNMQKNKSDYFTVKIPEDLEQGYYLINDTALFYNATGEFIPD